MHGIVLEVARLDLNKVLRKSPQGFKDFRRLACHLLAVDTLEVFHVVWLHLERVHCLWSRIFASVAICGLRSQTHINTFISSLPAYLPIEHRAFDREMQVSIFGILPSDFVFRNSCKVFWKIWFVIPKT